MQTARLTLATVALLLTANLTAPPATAGPNSAPAHRRPERVLLTFSGDPATEIAVNWRRPAEPADAPIRPPVAQIIEASPGPDLGKGRQRTVAATTTPVEDVRERHTSSTAQIYSYHTARLDGLTPATKYAYRVGNGTEWSEWNHFTTAHAPQTTGTVPGSFRFIYLGDAQNDVLSLWSRVVRDAVLQTSDARFILHAGDLIDMGNDDQEWGEWFEGAGWINRVIPVIATPGNHEYIGFFRGDPRQLSKLWRPQFEFPKNGIPQLPDTNYYIDYQSVRIISLDSNALTEEQTPWLESVLADNPNRWTILTFHHPIHSTAAKRDNPRIRQRWMPLVDKYKVDLVLQGHDHTYGRTHPLEAGTIVTPGQPGGTVYVVSVSGPKMYEISTNSQTLMPRRAEDTQFHQVITVDNDKLQYESRTAAGQLYDAFTLTKTPQGNQFSSPDNLPAERLRKAQAREAESD
jgi:hypothetical protein